MTTPAKMEPAPLPLTALEIDECEREPAIIHLHDARRILATIRAAQPAPIPPDAARVVELAKRSVEHLDAGPESEQVDGLALHPRDMDTLLSLAAIGSRVAGATEAVAVIGATGEGDIAPVDHWRIRYADPKLIRRVLILPPEDADGKGAK